MKMRNQIKMFQTKETEKSLETSPNETELCDFPYRELEIALIKMDNEVVGKSLFNSSIKVKDKSIFKNYT